MLALGDRGGLSKCAPRHIELACRGQRFQRIGVDDLHADPGMPDRGSEVRQRRITQLLTKTRNGKSTRFEFQDRGDTIQQLKAISWLRHTVRMQINKTGADHQSARIDHVIGLKRCLANRLDPACPNTHRPHSIQPTLRIDHPAVINHNIVGLRRLSAGNQR